MPTRPAPGWSTPIFADEEMTLARYRHGPDASFDRAAGWLYEGMAKAFDDNAARLAIVGDNPMLLVRRGPGQGRARQQGELDRLQAGAGEDHRLRHQLEHRRLSQRLLGQAGVSRTTARMSRWRSSPTRSLPRRASMSTIRSPPGETHNAALRQRTDWLNGERFHALHYTGPGTDLTVGLADGHEWKGGASTGKERHHLQPEHPDRGSLHHAACAARRGLCRQHQAAVPPGHADRRHPGAVRGGQDRRGEGQRGRGGAAKGARHRRRRAPARRGGAGAAFLADLARAGCCSTTRCSTRTPPATSRSASAIRTASSTAPSSRPSRSPRRAATRALSTSTG